MSEKTFPQTNTDNDLTWKDVKDMGIEPIDADHAESEDDE